MRCRGFREARFYALKFFSFFYVSKAFCCMGGQLLIGLKQYQLLTIHVPLQVCSSQWSFPEH